MKILLYFFEKLLTSEYLFDTLNTVNTDIGRKMEKNKTSVYIKIADDIKRRVALGIIRDGDKLPSCRELAFELGINPNTVQRAYSTLEEEGVIYTVPKKGVYVSGGKTQEVKKIAAEKIAELKAAGLAATELEEIIKEVYGLK